MPNALPTSHLPDRTQLAPSRVGPGGTVTLDSPALAVVTDLTEVRAATVQPHTSLSQAESRMIHLGVRLLFVVSDMPQVDGIVTAADLQGEKPMRLVIERQLRHGDLTVGDVMHRLSDLDAVEYDTLSHTTVGRVVATLLKFGRPYLLVRDTDPDGQPRVRGLVSLTQVERQLGSPLPSLAIATTFAEIEKALLS